jgi:hypothetical protein
MYCFTDNPKNYNKNGSVNFKNLNYKSTHLDISFLQQYNVQSQFSLNMYYYGYKSLKVANGVASFSE